MKQPLVLKLSAASIFFLRLLMSSFNYGYLAAEETISTSRGLRDTVNPDRKSTRLNSSHGYISYAVFCLKKKKKRSTPCCHLATGTTRRRRASPRASCGTAPPGSMRQPTALADWSEQVGSVSPPSVSQQH